MTLPSASSCLTTRSLSPPSLPLRSRFNFQAVTRPALSNPPDPPVPPDPPPPNTDLKPTSEYLPRLLLVMIKTSLPLPPTSADLTCGPAFLPTKAKQLCRRVNSISSSSLNDTRLEGSPERPRRFTASTLGGSPLRIHLRGYGHYCFYLVIAAGDFSGKAPLYSPERDGREFVPYSRSPEFSLDPWSLAFARPDTGQVKAFVPPLSEI